MTIPTCPFCWASLNYPVDIQLSAWESILGGSCFLCGARFIVDVTGKNVGEAVVQGLEMIAEELGKSLETLEAGLDYEDCVLGYDVKRHQTTGPASKFRDGLGRLYIIKTIRDGRRLQTAAICH